MNNQNNIFIAFEGIDGSGKSTQVALLADALKELGHKVHTTCEPTYSRIGQIIRDAFTRKIHADHRVIAGLFVADRLDHLLDQKEGILKKLEQGYTVITDRYYLSSYAYQGVYVPQDWVIRANSLSVELRRPDLNIFVDIDPEISMNRLRQNRENTELYETLENLEKVRTKYFEAIKKVKNEENILIVDGDRTSGAIAANILAEVEKLIHKAC